MPMKIRIIRCAAALLGASLVAAAGAQVSFTQIAQLPPGTGNGNVANRVSGDGRYVVGESDSANTPGVVLEDGFRFDRTTSGLVSVGALNLANFSTHASGVSANGSVVVGFSKQLIGTTNTQRAYIWNAGTGVMTPLGIPSGTGANFAYGVSGDGLTVVGNTSIATTAAGQAYRWTALGGFQILPALAGGGASSGRACSSDGSVVVGDSASTPFRWTGAGGPNGTTTAIPPIAGSSNGFGEALGVSDDGSVVVGAITSPTLVDSSLGFPISQGVAFRWTAAGTRAVGVLPSTGTQTSESFAVSSNGLVIVGDSRTSGNAAAGSTLEAFVWTPRWGIVTLASRLGAALPAGVRLDVASGISSNGRVVCGSGTTLATGRQFAFSATINSCIGDHNDSGSLEVQDIFDFLGDWFAGLPRADANGSGSLEVQDIFDFLAAWFGGC